MGELYTCKDVAERYGVQIITVWEWIRKKKLGAIKSERSTGSALKTSKRLSAPGGRFDFEDATSTSGGGEFGGRNG